MKKVTIHEAKTNLSKLLLGVVSGEEVIISRAGKPIARLVPFEKGKKPRVSGQYIGKIEIGEDFDAPLPEKITKHFRK